MSFWTKCLNRFHFIWITTLQTEVSLVNIGRGGSPCLCSVHRCWYVIGGLHTLKNAILQRMPLSPYIAIQM